MPFVFRLRTNGFLAAAALTLGLVGCSMYPLPDDVSRASTVDIVRQLRCEAQAGLRSIAREHPQAQKIVAATTIGYDFKFIISETNGAGSGMLNFARQGVGDLFKVDVGASASLTRANTRRFEIIETLEELDHTSSCTEDKTGANPLHPITGTVGIDEVVSTYIRLEMLSNLTSTMPTVFSDNLQFTTNLAAGVSPTLDLDAVVGRLTLTKASVSFGASRNDMHSVVIAMTRTPGLDVDPSKGGTPFRVAPDKEAEKEKGMRKALIKANAVRDPRAQAALVQQDENARTRVLLELKRRRKLSDDKIEPASVLGQRLLDVLKGP